MGQLTYREVTGFFTARIPDSGDADLNPDTVPLTGNVTFHPEYRKPLVFPGEHIVLEPINAIIIDGQLMVEVIQGEDVVLQALHLPVTMDERANQTWSWTMRFHGMTLGQYGETVELPDVRFVIEEGDGPLDLSEVTGTWSGGTLITRGAPGPGLQEIVAENGEITFLWDNSRTTTIGVPDTVPGPPGQRGPQGPAGTVELVGGAATITVDTSVGTCVRIGNIIVGGTTGPRDVTTLVQNTTVESGAAEVVRSGSSVTLTFRSLQVADAGSASLMVLPSGFRPATSSVRDMQSEARSGVTAPKIGYIDVYRSGAVWCQRLGPGEPMSVTLTYTTADPWPSSLPGSPA